MSAQAVIQSSGMVWIFAGRGWRCSCERNSLCANPIRVGLGHLVSSARYRSDAEMIRMLPGKHGVAGIMMHCHIILFSFLLLREIIAAVCC